VSAREHARRESSSSDPSASRTIALELLVDVDALAEVVAARVLEALSGQTTSGQDGWRLVGVEGAAELLGCSKRSIANYVTERGLPYIKIGSRRMYDVDDLREWARDRRVPAEDGLVRALPRTGFRNPAPRQAFGDRSLSGKQKVRGR
jgi:excisionase family DNA binding protein